MSKYAKNRFIWLIIIAIACVFLMPIAHLEPTALRAARMASTLLASFGISAAALAAPFILIGPLDLLFPQGCTASAIPIIDLDCARLC
jgi:hypothetical protein